MKRILDQIWNPRSQYVVSEEDQIKFGKILSGKVNSVQEARFNYFSVYIFKLKMLQTRWQSKTKAAESYIYW